MSCQVEQIADCGDISTLGRALFIKEKEGKVFKRPCSIMCIYFRQFNHRF